MTFKALYNRGIITTIDQEQLTRYKRGLVDGAVLAMTFEPWDDKRSRSQQGLLHEIIGRYARANREKLDAVKVRWKVDIGYYLPAADILDGSLAMPKWRGRWCDLHDVYPDIHAVRTIVFLRSEADYTKVMENEFIDYALQSCEASGVNVADIMQELTRD